MKTLISSNPLLLMAMSRFGISLGFGESSVEDICRRQGVHTGTFLAVANFFSHGTVNTAEVSVEAMTTYLKNSHTYFLDFWLPLIRRRLIEAIDCSGADEVAMLIIKFYDEYTAEVSRHMQHENNQVFGYVDRLLHGQPDEDYDIAVFASGHHSIDTKLDELKDIIIRYLPQKQNNLLNSVLFDIINCREDLMTHCAVEDKLYIPAVQALEERVASAPSTAAASAAMAVPDRDTQLSQREKDIIIDVAKGLSNKEIADHLCISVHTVTTHRRNIASKLQIHSPAGLAIYAVINGLVTLDSM